MAISLKKFSFLSLIPVTLGSFFLTQKVFANNITVCVETLGDGGTLKLYDPSDKIQWSPFTVMDNTRKGSLYCYPYQSASPHGAAIWNTENYYIRGNYDQGYKEPDGVANNLFLRMEDTEDLYADSHDTPTYTFILKTTIPTGSTCTLSAYNSNDDFHFIPIKNSTFTLTNNDNTPHTFSYWSNGQANINIFSDNGNKFNQMTFTILDKFSYRVNGLTWIPPGKYDITSIDCGVGVITLQQAD